MKTIIDILNKELLGKKIKVWRAESSSPPSKQNITYFIYDIGYDIDVCNIWEKVDEVTAIIKSVFASSDEECEYLNFIVDITSTTDFEAVGVIISCIGLDQQLFFKKPC